jgi:hypothetical protein
MMSVIVRLYAFVDSYIHAYMIKSKCWWVLMGSIGDKPPTSKMVPHACRVISRTLHAYESIVEDYVFEICDHMWRCVHDYAIIWRCLSTFDDGVELLILWNYKIRMCILDIPSDEEWLKEARGERRKFNLSTRRISAQQIHLLGSNWIVCVCVCWFIFDI